MKNEKIQKTIQIIININYLENNDIEEELITKGLDYYQVIGILESARRNYVLKLNAVTTKSK
ncbi:MAG: hypothetical protein KBE91_01610 [Bacteroidia bacterium]|nr:hypothetical protein [Bacteroidia bacterium]